MTLRGEPGPEPALLRSGAQPATPSAPAPRSPPWRRSPNLHTRVGVALGALILALALALAGMMSRTAETQVVRQSAANLTSLSAQMSRELAVGMDRFAQAALTQTDRDLFRDPAASVAAMRDALERYQRMNPEFAYVSIVDIDSAKVIAATGGVFEGGNARGRPVFEKGRKGLFVGDVHDAVRLAELLPKPPNGEALRFLDVAVPIADASGKVFRVFATHVAWHWTNSVRVDVFGPMKAESGVDAFLADTEGKVVLAAVPSVKVGTDLKAITALAGRPAAVVAWPDGGEYLTVVSATAPHGNFPDFGWKVVARQPAALAAAAASDLRTAFLVGALLLGLGGAALAWMLTGRLVRPVRELAETAAHAQAGEPIAGAANLDAAPEIALVHTAMVRLADTARLEAEAKHRSQRQFAVLADSLPQVVFQTDAAGHIDYINKAWLKEGGPDGAPALGALAGLMSGADRDAFGRAWQASLASGEPLSVRCRIQAPGSATPRWFDVDARAVTSDLDVPLRWVGTVFDVHDMTTRAEETRRLLEQERDARLEAERAARLRDEFLATVSHELRSPLSVITGWSDILKRKGSDIPMVVKAAEVIRINARLQSALINDLLDITAVMAGKLVLNREPVDLSRIAEEVVLSHLHAAQTRGVALACRADLPVLVDGDRLRLTQVIANLVGNAIKFTDAGGAIEVTVAEQARHAVASVGDTGRGIAPAFLPHVFERMRQEDASVTRRAGGLGLGLAIVQGLVALHDGSVAAHSDGVGHGSMFTLTLPLASEPLDASVRPNPRSDDDLVVELIGQRILLVDDEAAAREVAQVALSSLGAEVRTAASASEALRILERERFDVLVSDIGMPEMDGLTLLRTLRALPDERTRAIPAVALTAFAMESHRRAGIDAGFHAYVAKPISLRRLSEAVASAVAAAAATAEAGRVEKMEG